MYISDIIYGEFLLEEVLADLINSQEVQRLKDIHMVGPSYLLNPVWNETRYEHSIGVMLLIRKVGGSLEEQIAGLLHDISHTIFSHVIDMVMKRQGEDYHEEIKNEYISKSSVPKILKKYGFNYESILFNDSQWQILEQEAPKLCADRVDYTLREVYRYFNTDLKEIHHFIDNVEIKDNQIVLGSLNAGEWFIKQYKKVVIDLFYDSTNIYAYEIMSNILTYALEKNFIVEDDLMKTETAIINQLNAINDEELISLMKTFYEPVELKEVAPDKPYDIFQKKKTRLVDPLVDVNDELVTTTVFSEKARKINQEILEKSAAGIFLLIESINLRDRNDFDLG